MRGRNPKHLTEKHQACKRDLTVSGISSSYCLQRRGELCYQGNHTFNWPYSQVGNSLISDHWLKISLAWRSNNARNTKDCNTYGSLASSPVSLLIMCGRRAKERACYGGNFLSRGWLHLLERLVTWWTYLLTESWKHAPLKGTVCILCGHTHTCYYDV